MSGRAAQVRLEVADRRQAFAEYDECGAAEWTATLLAELHNELDGRVPAIAGDRTPRRRRKQLDGQASLPLEDLFYIGLNDPAAGRIVMEHLAAAFGYEPPVAVTGEPRSPAAELADVVESFSTTAAEFTRAAADGELSGPEVALLSSHASRLAIEVLQFQLALRKVTR